jgi:TQXA domain-containing protein
MKKRVVSMLLAVVMMLGMFPGTALAAGSVEEALGEVNIYNGEQKLSYLSINGRVRELIYTYYNYVDRNGQTKEIPAYCVNPNIKGVPQTVAPGESIKYLANEIGSDPKVMGIIANGYPHRSLSELKLENKYQAYYATKMALWAYLLPNWDINNMKVNIGLCLVGVIIGEFLAARAGLGYLIIYGSQTFKMDYVVTSIVILCTAAIVLYALLTWAESAYNRYYLKNASAN